MPEKLSGRRKLPDGRVVIRRSFEEDKPKKGKPDSVEPQGRGRAPSKDVLGVADARARLENIQKPDERKFKFKPGTTKKDERFEQASKHLGV